ncbi:YaeQ protein [Thioalkalivibrio nitratireducens DSM 14787]|uniref:YaeQ protein n=1 Tax=Thioalkalivibrio nitratireducens (strain DSM 14787 / UNIQEM 213 / ALEN2) TaxID=1255043 RepID=L0E063_THIND|nr:YaeQ family protein [Thioalkalivibrio nitratireducens]AGA34637.1 YaeQ protein [Thioalkalivibrio nitratireducens DSM 14787]
MALKATIFKVDLQVADMDRSHYGSHVLTLARHPSETDERLMMRLLAFCLYASDSLRFGRGLSTEDEADLFDPDPTGSIAHWVDVGTPDARDIRKACGQARQVTVLAYGRTVGVWWRQHGVLLSGQRNLTVLRVSQEAGETLAALASRNMNVQCTIQEGIAWVTCGDRTVEVALEALLRPGA